MANDIKLDSINKIVGTNTPITQREAKHTAHSHLASDSVKTSMSDMANQLLAENNVSDEQRIIELKAKVDHQQYKVDLNQLADKLSRSLFSIK